MAAMGPYDSNLQMFVETGREPDMRRLRFMRWLGEHGRLEHNVYGPRREWVSQGGEKASGSDSGEQLDFPRPGYLPVTKEGAPMINTGPMGGRERGA